MAAIQKNAVKKGERNRVSRLIHKKSEKEAIAGWKQDLLRILQIFNVRSVNHARRLLIVSLSDGAVDGYPFDPFRPPPPPVSKSRIHCQSTSIGKRSFLSIHNTTLTVS